MNTEGQDALVAEMERFARLAERLAREIRRLTVGIKADLDECLALARVEPDWDPGDDEDAKGGGD